MQEFIDELDADGWNTIIALIANGKINDAITNWCELTGEDFEFTELPLIDSE